MMGSQLDRWALRTTRWPHPPSPRRQIDLNSSKGCVQALQKWSALHAVEPNSLRGDVFGDPQKGQTTGSRRLSCTGLWTPECDGGAIP